MVSVEESASRLSNQSQNWHNINYVTEDNNARNGPPVFNASILCAREVMCFLASIRRCNMLPWQVFALTSMRMLS